MWNGHEFGQSRPPEHCVVCGLEVGDFKLHELGAIVVRGAEGDMQSDLADGGGQGSRDYPVERCRTGLQLGPWESHLVI